MSSQVLSPQASLEGPALEAWTGFLRAHAGLIRRLNAELVAEHGLTLNDYEVLLRLAKAPERAMRRIDLANSILLTASGVTRLLAGLEHAGFVERKACTEDARVTYAVLTATGRQKLREASKTHVRGVNELFAQRFSTSELETLASLLGRLADGETEACTVE